MTEKEFLNGDWWLVCAEYPVCQNASICEVLESEEDPLMNSDYANGIAEECVDSYGYLDDFEYDPELEESEEEQYEYWYDSHKEDTSLWSKKIDKDVIDEYGIEWLNSNLV